MRTDAAEIALNSLAIGSSEIEAFSDDPTGVRTFIQAQTLRIAAFSSHEAAIVQFLSQILSPRKFHAQLEGPVCNCYCATYMTLFGAR